MIETDEVECGGCCFYKGDSDVGTCCSSPPTVVVHENELISVRPTVSFDDVACSHFTE